MLSVLAPPSTRFFGVSFVVYVCTHGYNVSEGWKPCADMAPQSA